MSDEIYRLHQQIKQLQEDCDRKDITICGDSVKQKALEVLQAVGSRPINTTITHCTFTAGDQDILSRLEKRDPEPPTSNPLSEPDEF